MNGPSGDKWGHWCLFDQSRLRPTNQKLINVSGGSAETHLTLPHSTLIST